MVARVGGMVPAALDAVRAAGGFPGLWKAIAHNLEKLRACLHNPSFHQACQLETKNKAVCRELLQSVADMLAWATDIAGRCRGPLTAGKMQMRSSIDEVAVKLDISLRDCELLLKIGELYDEGPLDGTSTCVELQRLLAWLEMSHTEAKILALDGLLEALNKDEKRVVSMFGRDNVSAVVQLLTASWPEVVRDKAATVVCHVVITGSSNAWQLLESEVAIPPLIRLAKSGSQKAVVTLHHLSSTSFNTAWVIVSHGGIGPLIDMCNCCVKTGGDSVTQSAAAGTLKNISAAPHVRQLLADHGTVGAMVGLLHCSDALPESKEHAAECLINFTSSANDDCLRRAVVSEGGLYALLLYLGDTNWHEAGVRAIRNLVGVISTTSGDTTRMMKRLGGEQRCVPLLVRTMREVESGVSNSAREVAVQMLASLATYPPNAMKMGKDLACVAGLVHLLDPDRYNTRYKHAIQCLLSLTSTSKRCREIMTLLRTNSHLRRLSDLNVEGATELLHRLEGGRLRSLFGIRKQ
ncbi:hypothetical protein PR202_ga22504 [Eleusine coracana subsp. coracana]|uniref:DUF7032 domain-containing protein n=1 Tax=Eleusine coracana subsp. coracana TaxID=191504 RepID=A0AAV5D3T5_ELECO|nr:hypothetical protein PR202_ga22504 [Eleusine coracana subsp. coracana]